MEDTSTVISKSIDDLRRVWTANQIGLASFIAGPLGGCYLLGQNYRTFGKENHFRKSLMMGVIAALFLLSLGIFFELPEKFPKMAIVGVYTGVLVSFAKRVHGAQIKERLQAGHKKNSYFKLIFIAALLMLVQVAMGFGVIYLLSFFE